MPSKQLAGLSLSAAALLLAWAGCGPVAAQSIDELGAVAPYVDHCVIRGLRGHGFASHRDVTVRVSFRRDGSVIGRPAVTYSLPQRGEPEQERFIAALSAAITGCTPLPFSKPLGAAIAGRIFTFRYTLTDSKDQSI